MPVHWSIDFGTSNTTVCEDHAGAPHIVHLPGLAREEPLTQTPVIPSAVCVLDSAATRVLIGQQAVDYNWDGASSGFASSFKLQLAEGGTRPAARVEGAVFDYRDVTALFFRELLSRLEAQLGQPVADLTLATPMGFYETYRAELQEIVRRLRRVPWWARLLALLGVRRRGLTVRFVDEPVAAALGYGVDVGREAVIVAFDFGGGSLEIAAVRTQAGTTVETGRAWVLAKQSLRLGGDDVDQWIMDRFAPGPLQQWPEQALAMRWEAERVKLMASAGQQATYTFRNQACGTLDYQGLAALLAEHGLYAQIQDSLGRLIDELRGQHGLEPSQVDEVILEGGSTLLPEVRAVVGEAFGRDKVREWLPFESVARGACLFARGAQVEDFIYHDYALRVLDSGGHAVEYELLIPRGTRYPTAAEFATRYYAAGHDGQTSLNLLICEVGRVAGQGVAWQERPGGGSVFAPKTPGDQAFCIALNEGDSGLPLNPPGHGSAPRLRVTFAINAERWLCATVHDLLTKRDLRHQEPVVKLR